MSNGVVISVDTPPASDLLALRRHAGWYDLDEADVTTILEASTFVTCARCAGDLVGMARVVSDRRSFFYIQDLVVREGFRLRGVGFRLLQVTLTEIRALARPDAFVCLFAVAGSEYFYSKLGFTDYRGPNTPMTISVTES